MRYLLREGGNANEGTGFKRLAEAGEERYDAYDARILMDRTMPLSSMAMEKVGERFYWEGTLYQDMEPCEEVIRLQEMLRDLGYYSGSIRSGQFGSMTGSAVAKFQKANGLQATQVADPETIAQIETAWKALGQQAAQTAQEQAGN